ncbi:unnamed protein product [Closterium sp. Naga37s-1]|nr:unnamed protein product [Closterium sp. Naga37s-1]
MVALMGLVVTASFLFSDGVARGNATLSGWWPTDATSPAVARLRGGNPVDSRRNGGANGKWVSAAQREQQRRRLWWADREGEAAESNAMDPAELRVREEMVSLQWLKFRSGQLQLHVHSSNEVDVSFWGDVFRTAFSELSGPHDAARRAAIRRIARLSTQAYDVDLSATFPVRARYTPQPPVSPICRVSPEMEVAEQGEHPAAAAAAGTASQS